MFECSVTNIKTARTLTTYQRQPADRPFQPTTNLTVQLALPNSPDITRKHLPALHKLFTNVHPTTNSRTYIAVPEDNSCETGWLQFRQDKCYRFVHIRLAFDDAESLCNSLYGGHLPSIHSQEEQFMISQFLSSVNVKNGSEIWLGGRQMDFHNFNWGDGSQFNYSYWEHGEPNFPAEKCIEMSWRNGRWNDINCRLKRAVLCERQVTSRHHIKPILYQPTTCLESNCSVPATQTSPTSDSSALAPITSASSPIDAVTLSTTQNTTSLSQEAELPAKQASVGMVESIANVANRSSLDGDLHPLEDSKPIRVITSILHRDRSPVVSSELVGLSDVLNSTLIHSAPITVSLENTTSSNKSLVTLLSPTNTQQANQDDAPDLVKRQQVVESNEVTSVQSLVNSTALLEKLIQANTQQVVNSTSYQQNSPQVLTNLTTVTEIPQDKSSTSAVKPVGLPLAEKKST